MTGRRSSPWRWPTELRFRQWRRRREATLAVFARSPEALTVIWAIAHHLSRCSIAASGQRACRQEVWNAKVCGRKEPRGCGDRPLHRSAGNRRNEQRQHGRLVQLGDGRGADPYLSSKLADAGRRLSRWLCLALRTDQWPRARLPPTIPATAERLRPRPLSGWWADARLRPKDECPENMTCGHINHNFGPGASKIRSQCRRPALKGIIADQHSDVDLVVIGRRPTARQRPTRPAGG